MCEIIKLNPSRARFFTAYIKLVKELVSCAYKDILSKEDLEGIFNFINLKSFRKAYLNGGEEYFLIKNNEEEIGFFQIRQVDNYLDIARIYLKETYQNKKFGYKAFLKIIEIAKKKNFEKIIIYINKDFKDAQQAIEKWGFKNKKLTASYKGNEKYIYEYYYEYIL